MPRYKFEDIAINSTAKKKPIEEDKYTYLGLEHLDSGTLKVSRYGSEVAPIGDKLIMKKGDVLFGKRRAYQKKVAIAPFDGIFSAHGMVLRPKTDVIDEKFFPLFISSDYFLDNAIKISVGSLSPTINWKDLKELEFDLPDIDTQKKLAELLWSMNETIENYRFLIKKTDELVKSQFIEMISNREKTLKLRDVCENNIVNASKLFNKDSEINYVEISSIDGVNKKIVSPTKIKYKDAPSSAKYVLELGDVLVSLVRPNLKKITINDLEENNVVGTSGFCVLRANTKISPEIIRTIVTTDHFTNKMIDCATGSTYPTIKDSDILDYSICEFNEEEVCSLTKLVKQSDKSKFHLYNQLKITRRLKYVNF